MNLIQIEADELEQLRKDAERYRWLKNNKFNQLYLTCNEHKACYETAESYIEVNQPHWFKDVDPFVLARMKDADTIWELQIYPRTPIVFSNAYGNSLDYVIDKAMEIDWRVYE